MFRRSVGFPEGDDRRASDRVDPPVDDAPVRRRGHAHRRQLRPFLVAGGSAVRDRPASSSRRRRRGRPRTGRGACGRRQTAGERGCPAPVARSTAHVRPREVDAPAVGLESADEQDATVDHDRARLVVDVRHRALAPAARRPGRRGRRGRRCSRGEPCRGRGRRRSAARGCSGAPATTLAARAGRRHRNKRDEATAPLRTPQ